MRPRDVIRSVPALVAIGGLAACAQPGAPRGHVEAPATLTIVHLNDVYEILPVY